MNVGRKVRWPLGPFCGVIVTAPASDTKFI
jgi:hypothetical protein